MSRNYRTLLRRTLMAGGVVLGVAFLVSTGWASNDDGKSTPYTVSDAKQDIEELRRLYAIATDLLGLENDPASLARGEAIYRRIFTTDADISVLVNGVPVLTGTGPEEWATVVKNALGPGILATQHMIGTQLAQVQRMPNGAPDKSSRGRGEMSSYLRAWHALPPVNSTVNVFIGTYFDSVRTTPGVGWQIYKMVLVRVSGGDWRLTL